MEEFYEHHCPLKSAALSDRDPNEIARNPESCVASAGKRVVGSLT